MLPCTIPCHPWMVENVKFALHPGATVTWYILVYPPCQSIRGCQSYSGIAGPSTVTSIYWSNPLVRVSVDDIVTLVSLDHPWLPVYTGLPPLSEYPWMPELLWYPWTIHDYQYILVYPPTPLVRVSLYHPWLPVYTGLPPLSEYPWMPELLWYPWTIHGYQYILVYPPTPLVRVSLYHSWLPVYTGLPPLSEYPWIPELLWYPWTVHGYQYILVYPLVRVSMDAIVTLVSLDHPWSPLTSIYWSTPLVRVSMDYIVTLVSLDLPIQSFKFDIPRICGAANISVIFHVTIKNKS